MSEKFQTSDILNQYRSGVNNYKQATLNIGLWKSELETIKKYVQKEHSILDLGCGTGRTTFALYEKGYKNIEGIDLTPEMIDAAKTINKNKVLPINFSIGNAIDLLFKSEIFDAVLFSFNGLFSIPKMTNRQKAMLEIHRVLKHSGIFIFTTHDREGLPEYFPFWKEEEERWQSGKQNERLHEFGDLFVKSRNESEPIFIHIPDQKEVTHLLHTASFTVLDTFMRDARYQESQETRAFASNCRFWIASKL